MGVNQRVAATANVCGWLEDWHVLTPAVADAWVG